MPCPIPGFSSLKEFAQTTDFHPMTVYNQMRQGYCAWPKRTRRQDNRSKHPLYKTWDSMIGRCCHLSNASYKFYGGRGIEVCDRWRSDFLNFLHDMGEKPEGHTLDRIDPDKGYFPENCRWATQAQQVDNKSKRPGSISQMDNGYWDTSLIRLGKRKRAYLQTKEDAEKQIQEWLDEYYAGVW